MCQIQESIKTTQKQLVVEAEVAAGLEWHMIPSINVESKKNSLCLPEKTNFIKVSDMQWNWVLCTCSNNHKVIQ